jgi:DNA-binding NarL/FixJ family response regulator
VDRVEHPMPRLVLLDVRLSGMSGLDVRSQPDLHYLAVVMLTSSNRKADRDAAAAVRADQYLLKPGPFGEWVAMVNEAHELGRHFRHPGSQKESSSAEAQRVLYFALASAIEGGLVRTMEDVLSVLRQASQPLGPMGAEWLARQEQALKRDDQ